MARRARQRAMPHRTSGAVENGASYFTMGGGLPAIAAGMGGGGWPAIATAACPMLSAGPVGLVATCCLQQRERQRPFC